MMVTDNNRESISQFYKRIQHPEALDDVAFDANKPYFNVLHRKCNFGEVHFSFRDFYKVTLIVGKGKLYYADKWVMVDRPALLFSNPLIPYAWESVSEEQKGYFCIFNELFVNSDERKDSLADTPLFKVNSDKVFFLDEERVEFIDGIYQKMMEEMKSDYPHRFDVVRCYLHLLIHEAMKMQPENRYVAHRNASQRISDFFFESLEREFPVPGGGTLQLRTATDFANRLSVHVNHLNRAIKETTGRTTSEWIAERIVKESTQLLLHSDLTVAEIGYSLGFETPSYFNSFYRKHTGQTPGAVRV